MRSDTVLLAEGLSAGYGRKEVVRDISLEATSGDVIGLLGPNGAGKTTIFRALAGVIGLTSGEVRLLGQDVTRIPVAGRIARGLGFVPEGGRVFRSMSVRENLELGGFLIRNSATVEERLGAVFSFFPRLGERLNIAGGNLSGGERQMLAIGRTLMLSPRVLLLDEPFIGLSPVATASLIETLAEVRDKLDVTILIAEQNIWATMELASRAFLVRLGEAVETSEKVSSFEQVEELGRSYFA